MDFTTGNSKNYNLQLTNKELSNALKKSHENASVLTAEVQVLKILVNIVKTCDDDCFVIFTDLLSNLQALGGNNCDHPYIQDMFKSLKTEK